MKTISSFHSLDSLSLLDPISHGIDSCIYVIDYFQKKILHISGNSRFLCGCKPDEVKEMGYDFFVKKMPEHDWEMVRELTKAGMEKIQCCAPEDIWHYEISCDLHLLVDGRKQLIHHKFIPWDMNLENKKGLAVCILSFSPSKTAGNVMMHKDNTLKYWSYSLVTRTWKEHIVVTLSKQCKEILILSSQGYKQREIADRLCLSEDTIRSHKKKIFKELEVDNIISAINMAKLYDLL